MRCVLHRRPEQLHFMGVCSVKDGIEMGQEWRTGARVVCSGIQLGRIASVTRLDGLHGRVELLHEFFPVISYSCT